MKPQFILTALDRFSCLADRCSIDCCSRFRVDVDVTAYNQWRSLADTDAHKPWLLEGARHEENNGKERIILLNKENSRDCVFLTPDRLCSIHAGLGPEFLPKICREYPRKRVSQPDLEVAYGEMSCVEMARLVMFDGSAPVFRQVAGRGKKAARSADERVVRSLYKILRKVLASSGYPFNVRLAYLAGVVAEITTQSERGQLTREALGDFERSFDSDLRHLVAEVRSGKVAANPPHGTAIWDLLRTGAVRFGLFQSSGLPEEMPAMELAKRAISESEAKPLFYQELMSLREAHRPRLQPFMPAFERYLESRFMAQGFPLARRHPVVAFMASVGPFAVIQMLLWMKAAVSPQLSEEDILSVVVKVEEKLCHSDELAKTVEGNPALLNIGGYRDWFLEVC